jgi:iron complex outermembrane receptor protein
VIRGLSGFRVRIQENGLSSGDVSALSDDHGVPIDPLVAGQVEVVRGPATLRYGSQAIGGVVNAVNNASHDDPTTGILVDAAVQHSRQWAEWCRDTSRLRQLRRSRRHLRALRR